MHRAYPAVLLAWLLAAPGPAGPTVATGYAPEGRQTLGPVPKLPLGSTRRVEEIRRFPAQEARQGVAVDDAHFYAVDNARIGKYEKAGGARVAEWSGEAGGPIVHLNSCIVVSRELVCAHSNYPAVPMLSSIEVWDAATLRHMRSHSFGIHEGSLTWAIPKDGDWWLSFAHYGGRGGRPGMGPEWTALVRFAEGWRRTAGYAYPVALIERIAPYSFSGGNWGADGLLYVTGHDAPEIYVLRLPTMGSVLEWVETIPAPMHGQAWVFDPVTPGTIWGIQRASGAVVAGSLIAHP